MHITTNFYLTDKCTFGCPFCLHNASTGGKDMTIKQIRQAFTILKDCVSLGHRTECIGTTGGEPTESANWDYYVSILKQMSSANLELFTNGSHPNIVPEKLFRVINIASDRYHNQKRAIPLEEWIMKPSTALVINKINFIRNKGRGIKFITQHSLLPSPVRTCCHKYRSPNMIHLNFSPDNIRFCSENCNEGDLNFRPYGYDTKQLIEDADHFFNDHTNDNCPNPCFSYNTNEIIV